jgi:L-fuconolactonase
MFGSDWPVALLAGTYEKVFNTICTLASNLEESERSLLMGGTAIKTYQLDGV